MLKKSSARIGLKALAAAIIAATSIQSVLAAKMPTKEEMWQLIQKQQKQIERLEQRLEITETQQKQTDAKIEATGEALETKLAQVEESGVMPGWWKRTKIGGYGELHYNGGQKDEIDFHRFVLMVNHDFTDDIRFVSELELEHSIAGDGQNGEIELEQAYVEFDLNDNHQLKAGLFLIPIGILNEKHEPSTFFGTERNPVEKNIIPTTWWEGGLALKGNLGSGFGYDLAFHSGLKATEDKDFAIRSGRQKVSNAPAENGAGTARVTWQGIPGVKLAVATQYQDDITQNDEDIAGGESNISATLWEANADIRKGPFGLRALYAKWNLDGDKPKETGADKQKGWYVEPAYYFSETDIGQFGVFTRYSEYDNKAGDGESSNHRQRDLGLNYWPHKNVVLKADYSIMDEPSNGEDDKRLNLGVGFHF